MDYSIYRLNLDIKTDRSQALLKVFKGDTQVKLVCMLTDGGRVFQLEDTNVATLTLKMPDGSKRVHSCYIFDNSIVYPFTEDTTNLGDDYNEGMIDAQLNLYGGVVYEGETPKYSQTLAMPKFSINVSESETKPDDPIYEGTSDAIGIVLGAAAKEYAREQAEDARDTNEKARQESYNTAITTANEAKSTAEKALNEVESLDFDYNTTTHELTIKYFKDGAEVAEVLDLNLEAAIIDVDDEIGEDGLPKIRFVFEKDEAGKVINATDFFDLESLITMTNYVQKTDFEKFARTLGTSIPAEKESEGLAFDANDDASLYVVSGIGTCNDTEIVIPEFYRGDPEIVIPESNGGKPVAAVMEECFAGQNNITKVVFPSNINTEYGFIEGLLFEGCNHKVTFDFTKCTKVPTLSFTSQANAYLYSKSENLANIEILVRADMVDAFKKDTHFKRYADANCITALTIKGNYIAIEELSRSVKAYAGLIQSIDTKVDAKADASRVAELEAESAILEKRVANLEGATLEFTEDSTVAYHKVVPADASKYALVNKVGGMTYKSHPNYLEITGVGTNLGGVETTINDDGSITIVNNSGFAGKIYFNGRLNVSGLNSGYFTIIGDIPSGIEDNIGIYIHWIEDDYDEHYNYKEWMLSKGATLRETDTLYVGLTGEKGTFTIHPIITDTEEPITEIWEGLRDTKVSELKSEGANLIPRASRNNQTIEGITYTVREDNSIVANGTATKESNFSLQYVPYGEFFELEQGETYTLSGCPKGGSKETYRLIAQHTGYNQNFSDAGDGFTGVANYSKYYAFIRIAEGCTANNLVFKPMLNRGSVAKPYSLYGTVDTFLISAELRTFLEDKGYGRGVSGYPNYIDFERKVFVPMVKEVDMGDLSWSYKQSNGRSIFSCGNIPDIQGFISDNRPINAIAADYRAVKVNATWVDRDIAYGNSAIGYKQICIVDNRYTDAESFKQSVKGKKLIYAVENPIPIDISAYLPDDNFIEVEGGGTITAVNEYEQDAPSTISYVSAMGG